MSNGRKMSRKEQEILQRQRAVARQRDISRQQHPPPSKPPPPRAPPPSSRVRRPNSTSISQLLGKKSPSKLRSNASRLSENLQSSTFRNKSDSVEVIDLTEESNDARESEQLKPQTSTIVTGPGPRPGRQKHNQLQLRPSVKRPSMKRPPAKMSSLNTNSSSRNAVNAVIIASRSRLKKNDNSLSDDRRPAKALASSVSGSIAAASSSSGKGRLSSLLNQAGVTRNELKNTQANPRRSWEEQEDREGTALDMDDYYKNLREWDFLFDWDQERRGGAKPTAGKKKRKGKDNSSGGSIRNLERCADNSASSSMKEVTIPDTFTSRRQYQKLWAPLCLAEARAQFLSTASGNLPWQPHSYGNNERMGDNHRNCKNRRNGRNNDRAGPLPIMVKPSVKDVGANVDAMTLVISPMNGNMGPSFNSGDLVVLACNESVFIKASKGFLFPNNKQNAQDTNSVGLHGITGHVEFSRRTLDGLKVRISRRQWVKICKSKKLEKMLLLKVGGNVTSMREFTALSKANTLAMLPYLLCRKMTKAKDNFDRLSNVICGVSGSQSKKKDKHLNNMGGKVALGEGFAKYASNKFNNSQLGAISAAASEYGSGGFTLVKGPPGTGKTTTLVALLNALHIRQFNQYYSSVKDIVDVKNTKSTGATKAALTEAAKQKPRLLVCAPSNNAIDNVIQKIMEGGFIDGAGNRYNPSIVRVGVGQSEVVKDVSLESKVKDLMSDMEDAGKIQSAVSMYQSELSRIQKNIHQTRRRLIAMLSACDYPLAMEWEIRCDNSFKVHYVNHLEKRTTYETPPPPEPDESFRETKAMPEYKLYMTQLIKLVDRFASISSKLDRYGLIKKPGDSLRLQLETHILDTTHIVLTTLGTSGCLALESSKKFEVVVIDEAAQSCEPSTLVGLQLGSSHAILVGDPQQLPATIFSISGRTTKYDRSLFQRLEEAGHEVHLLDTQYRMHPMISKFPRHIFYGGYLKDGPNVKASSYGNPLLDRMRIALPSFHPFTVFDLDSTEERGGSSLSNSMEARFAAQLYQNLTTEFGIFVSTTKVAIITPYAQQAALLRRIFSQALGHEYHQSVEIHTVDSFQGREANIVIFSCVRAAGSKGIGFLSDVRRMNVALTRAKHFLFVIARCESICINPYWGELVKDARQDNAVISVPVSFVDSDYNLSTLRTQANKEVDLTKKRRRIEPTVCSV